MAGILGSDAWGTDIGLDATGDLAVGPTGDLGVFADADNLVQALRSRMMTAAGELPLHPDYGSVLSTEIIGSKNTLAFADVAQLQNELAALVTQDPRFIRADVTAATQDGDTDTIQIVITAVDGSQITVGGVPQPRLLDTSTAAIDAATGLPVDEVTQQAFFADQSEADTLANADFLTQLASDLSGTTPTT